MIIALGTFLVALGAIGVLIACGIAINLYLYSQGAFGRRRFSRPQRLEPAFAGHDTDFYYQSMSTVDKGMSHYARKIVATFLSIVIVLCLVVALLLSSAQH